MSKLLITGGAGFIGSNLVDTLIDKGHEVTVIDNLSSGKKENVNKKATFFEVDITDKDSLRGVFEKFSPEAIFHLAAQVSVRVSCEKPAEDVKTNVIGTINLLELAVQNKVKKFIFSSTGGAIYGDGVDRPTIEEAKEDPVSPYGINKLSSEKFISFFAKSSSLQTVCLRYANVYGKRQDPHGEAGAVAIFAGLMLKGKPVTIYGSGEQTRDFVYVSDVVEANLAALDSDQSDTYNVGTGIETNINDIANLMKEITKSTGEIKHATGKPGEQLNSALSFAKIKENLGFEPKTKLQEGLEETVNYFEQTS